MVFRPDDLETKAFGTTRRGYDPGQVRTYLSSIASSMRAEEQHRQQERDASGAAQQDAKEIIEGARLTARSIRAEARREADDLLTEAQLHAQTPAAVPHIEVGDRDPETAAKAQRLLELRAETERLRLEAVEALEAATAERERAEQIRAESHLEIQRLRSQVDSLRLSAEQQIRSVQPGAMMSLSSAMSSTDHPDSAALGEKILVVDGSQQAENPLASAVRSAVGGAVDPKN